MKPVLCGLSLILLVGIVASLGATISRPVDAQDRTEERLSALETQVAKQTKDLSSVRKRLKKLEDAGKTPTSEPADGSEATVAPTETTEAAAPAGENTSSYLGGNAVSLLSPGDKGKLSVVLSGTYDGNILPLVVRNNTDKDVIRIKVSAVARSADGKLIASGGDQGFHPNLVRAGEYSLGYLYFDGIELPADALFEFEVSAKDASDNQFESTRDLDVTEADYLDNRIVGLLQNNHTENVTGPMGVSVVCLDGEGTLLGHHQSFTDKDEAAPGESIPFQVELYGATDCSNFLVAASGFNF